MSNCIFCDSEKHEKIIENEGAYAMLSITPAMPGHAIIVPKPHARNHLTLTDFALRCWLSLQEETFEVIKEELKRNPNYLKSFYERLIENPPLACSQELGHQMLRHPYLRMVPEAYNLGSNHGKTAGQTLDHTHIHLFPRRSEERENGKNGIVEAMRQYLG